MTTATKRYELHDLDGNGERRTTVYPVASVSPRDYWESVTDIPCPIGSCDGLIRWAEAGYVAGYRICDKCGRHFLAKGSVTKPKLLRVGARRSKV
jgi:hypothetical protein